ncbi:transcriptional regulator [Clostridia bacterium]|nr:transcriptional regulator [Clostridia bacterium]
MKLQVTYKKLWHLLIERDMQRQELRRAAGISSSTIAKIVRGENVNTDILLKICEVLNCNFADIMDAVPITEENAEPPTEEQKC